MRRPQAAQGEGSAPALTETVTAEAGTSPNEGQGKERSQARLSRCFCKREARPTGGLVMNERKRVNRPPVGRGSAGAQPRTLSEHSQRFECRSCAPLRC